jgi:hypothetical protein
MDEIYRKTISGTLIRVDNLDRAALACGDYAAVLDCYHALVGCDAVYLDIATGKGAALIPAAHRLGPEGRVIGIDLSEAILQEHEEKGPRIIVEGNGTRIKDIDGKEYIDAGQAFQLPTQGTPTPRSSKLQPNKPRSWSMSAAMFTTQFRPLNWRSNLRRSSLEDFRRLSLVTAAPKP